MDENAVEKFLDRAMTLLGHRTQKAIAEDMGVSQSSVSDAKKRGVVPTGWSLILFKKYNINPVFLEKGEGNTHVKSLNFSKGYRPETKEAEGQVFDVTAFEAEPGEEPSQARARAGDYVYIPLYNVEAAAGGGAVVETEQVVDFLAFKREWVRRELGASPQDLYLLYIDGDSMEPSLRPGDIVLIDRRDAAISRDGIYILRLDSGLLVKRLQRLPGGEIRVTSDNAAYQPFTILLDKPPSDLAVIGRVVWMGRRV